MGRAGLLPLLYLWWIILLAITELGSPFPCLQYKILLTSFYLHFCRKLCRQEGRVVELVRHWDHLLQMMVLSYTFKQMQCIASETFALNLPLSPLSHCSQRKPQKVSLLFEDDASNGESFFSSQSTLLPSAAKAPVVPPLYFKTNMEHLVFL